MSKALFRYRWFVLGILFFILNIFTSCMILTGRSSIGQPRADLLSPKDGLLSGRDPAIWRFSADMIPSSAAGKWLDSQPVSFTPAVDGKCMWRTPNELVFQPANSWPACTVFKAVFTDDLPSLSLLPARHAVFSLRTPSLAFLAASQAEYRPNGEASISLKFSDPVMPLDLLQHLSIETATGSAITPQLASMNNAAQIQVRLAGLGTRAPAQPAPLAPPLDTDANLVANRLAVKVRAGLRSINGPLGLERDETIRVTLRNDLAIEGVAPELRRMHRGYVTVTANSALDLNTAGSFISVDPPMPITIEHSYGGNHRLEGSFQAGRNYRITFRAGLRSASGQFLGADVTHTVYFPDATLAVDFITEGRYMTPGGAMKVPFETINARKGKAIIERVYPNNLVYMVQRPSGYYWRSPAEGLSRAVAESEFPIQGPRNEAIPGKLDLAPLVGARRGAFRVAIEVRDDRDQTESANHLLVLSDIGLTVKTARNDLLIWANSIHTLAPLSNALVRLYSAENQELRSKATDHDGLARFEFNPKETEGTPAVITVQHGDDLTFLSLNAPEPSKASPPGSRPYLAEGYEACVFTERGIYRPGETARVKAILRGRDWACPTPFPVELTVTRADSVKQKRLTRMLTDFGSAEFEVPFPDYWRTGKYQLSVALPGSKTPLGDTTVSVEEFLPPQIRVSLKLSPATNGITSAVHALVSSEYFFGQPAAGLVSEMFVEFQPRPFAPARWPNYQFGNPQRLFKTEQERLGKKLLSPTGKAEFAFMGGSPRWRPPARITAAAAGVVTEISGRAVTAYANCPIDPYPFYIGIKQETLQPRADRPAMFRFAAVRPDGSPEPVSRPFDLKIDRLNWTCVLKDSGGHAAWVSEQQVTILSTNTVPFADGAARFDFTPPSYGSYRITLTDPVTETSSALDFYAGDEGQVWNDRSLENPDVVQLDLDKPTYRPGDTATLKVTAPFAGKALLTLESTRVLSARVLTFTNNTVEIPVPIEAAYAPNVYASITVIRPVRPEKIWSPHRARGSVSINVERPDRRLGVALSVPDETRPRRPLAVSVRVTDPEGKPAVAELVVAAVDESICSLTRFKTPDPYEFFLAPRRVEVGSADLYGELMPEIEDQTLGTPSEPGGDLIHSLLNRLNPIKARRFRSLALWSSTLCTDSNGNARVEMDLPEFSGEVRIMAVAMDRERFGSADRRIKVKSPIVVQSSLPRCLAPNDTFLMPVQVFNESGTNGDLRVALACSGPLGDGNGATSVVRTVALAAGASTNLDFTLRAGSLPGKAVCRLTAELADASYLDDIEIPVRPTAPRVTVSTNGMLAAGQTAGFDIPANWLAGTAQTELQCSSLPGVKLAGSLAYVVQYPYGCLEQTTSKSFPLLYIHDLAEELYPGWLNRDQIRNLVQAGIQRILMMQDYSGAFALWPHCDAYPWGSIYATHFLVEAKKAGYDVPEDRLNQACENLARWLSNAPSRRHGRHVESGDGDRTEYNISLACFVLADAGRPQHSWAARLFEEREHLERGARVNLAAALAAMRLKRDAQTLLNDPVVHEPTNTVFTIGGCLRSTVRDDAFLLSALLDFNPDDTRIPGLVQRLESCQDNGRWYTTHDNAMALMALGKYARLSAAQRKPISGRVTWSEGEHCVDFLEQPQVGVRFGDPLSEEPTTHTNLQTLLRRAVTTPSVSTSSSRVSLENKGAGPIFFSWKSEGVPADGQIEEGDRRVKILRTFLDADGKAVDPLNLAQGGLVVVRWTLSASETVDNLVIDDLLPAGLEVENASLKTSQSLPWIEAQTSLKPLHVDIRDDRMIAFTGPFAGERSFFYVTRAVTRGQFRLPPIHAECMYDPGIRSTRGAGVVRVAEKSE